MSMLGGENSCLHGCLGQGRTVVPCISPVSSEPNVGRSTEFGFLQSPHFSKAGKTGSRKGSLFYGDDTLSHLLPRPSIASTTPCLREDNPDRCEVRPCRISLLADIVAGDRFRSLRVLEVWDRERDGLSEEYIKGT